MERIIRRGDVFYAELNPVVGSEQGGTRPVLIISNNTGNRHSSYHCSDYEPSTRKSKITNTYLSKGF